MSNRRTIFSAYAEVNLTIMRALSKSSKILLQSFVRKYKCETGRLAGRIREFFRIILPRAAQTPFG